VEVATGDLARLRPWPGGDQPEVCAAPDVAALVVAEVEAGDPAGDRRPPLALLADDEAWIPGRRDERQTVPVRAPVDACHPVLEGRELPRLAAVEREDPGLRHGVRVSDRGPDEGQAVPIRRNRRSAVPDGAARQLAGVAAPHR